jgi:hypothetical protein
MSSVLKAPIIKKVCKDCGKKKKLTKFYHCVENADYLSDVCNKCQLANVKQTLDKQKKEKLAA